MTTGDCSFAAVARNLADRRCVNITKILMTFTSTSDLRELRSLTIEGWRLISTTIRNKVCIQFMHWYDACLPECEILPTTAPIYVMIHILHECKTVKYHYIYYMQKKPNYSEKSLHGRYRSRKKKLSANDCHSHNWSHNVSVFVEFCRLGQSPSSQKRIMGPKCANWWWFSSSHLQNVEENFSRSQPPCFLISSSSSSNLSPRLSCHRWIWLDPRGTENIWWRGLAPHKGWCKNLDPMIQKFHEIPSISWGSVEPSNSWAADSRMITAKHHDLQGIRLRTPCSLDLLPASGKM